jgi:hypothetical protein
MFTTLGLLGLIALIVACFSGLHLAPYIPNRDADALAWAQNFRDQIVASPSTYGLVSGDGTVIAAAVDAFEDAYALGGGSYHTPVNPATKTPTTTQAKVDAKTAMLLIVRPYAQQISQNAGVDASDKTAVGVNPRTSTPTPVPTPTSVPILGVRAAITGQTTLQYRDSAAVAGKAKPAGSIACDVYAKTSATPISDPNALTFVGTFTKSPFAINWAPTDSGKTAYIAARWKTRTGKVGAFSDVINNVVM